VRYRQRETAKYARGGRNDSGEGDEGRDTPRRGSRFWFGDPNAADHCRDHGRGLCFLGERDPSHSENNSIRLYRGLPLSPSLSLAISAGEQGASCRRVAENDPAVRRE